MKRYWLIVFLLMSGIRGAYADANSDAFNDASGFAQGNKHQGTSAASGTDPASVIPGYTTNPSQSSNYGGVRGGDGGIADKGQTSLGQNEAGQTVNDSSTRNPATKIDPNADFIQNGKNAEANGGSIVDGTGSQCSEKVVSKSVFENYSCDRDVNQIQTCARTASIQVTGSKETYNTEFVMDARNAPAHHEANWWLRYDYTVPDDGTLTSGSWEFLFPRAPNYHGDRLGYTMRAFGTSITTKYNYSGGFNISPQRVTKGQVVSMYIHYDTDGHYEEERDSNEKQFANGTLVFRIHLQMNAERDTTSSRVVWTESCSFDKSTATSSAGSQCVDPGGNRTITQNGRDYTQYSDCWQYSDAYVVPVNSTGNCDQLINNRNCTLAGRSCSQSEAGTCMHENDTYQCQTVYQSEGQLCGGQYFCRTGDCSETDGAGDNGFDMSVSKLAGLASAGDDVKNGSQIDIRAFTGQAMSCRKAVAGFSNCCVDTGWGNNAGLAHCNSEEMAIGKAKAKKVTVYVGDKCDHAVLGVCVQKSQVYCVFGSKLSRIIQEQGRRDQLHIGFGSGDSPNCRGITVPELQSISFDRINFQDFYSDLMANQKIPNASVMIQQAKDRVAAQVRAHQGDKK
ncbi:type-F conjugative transfer system mating-pair stabilization protein TraN [Pantoea stewartii]|uniref:type-F conjugative transfer system mating-pair stabilization protein TraN n=1 Tax=Pantoea stewartii TaxID=66269 RepID=UPI0023F9F73B|nr:type-F conjugative transfer system mating-pair stabilization protein TraN [Pantoea stewartii]MDF7788506.1 type-F conjugative transfer system mating-pair stabilization protein TraN [Pantoea stewartii]